MPNITFDFGHSLISPFLSLDSPSFSRSHSGKMPISAVQKLAIGEIISALEGMHAPRGKRLLCGMFMELVDREEWPQYYEVIPEPRCINHIKAGLEKGRYKDPLDVYTDLSLVFWNATFYNETKSQIAMDAEMLKTMLESEWKKRSTTTSGVLPHLPRMSPPPSSAQKVHANVMAVDHKHHHQPTSGRVKIVQPRQISSTSTQLPATTSIATTSTATTTNALSTTTHSSSTTSTLRMAPVPIRPKSVQQHASPNADVEVDIMTTADGDDNGTGDEMLAVAERDPESEEIVRQLEKGLPRWNGFGENGWIEDDLSGEKVVELVLAVKNHKDVNGNRLAVSLEAVPEESTTPHLSYTSPLSLKSIESRARERKYSNAKEFDKDMARFFEKARRHYEPCSETYGHVLLLQRFYQGLTSSNPPPGPPYISTQNFASLRAGPGTTKPVHGGDADGVAGVTTHRVLTRDRKFVDEVHYKGWTMKLADWVHLSNPDDPSRPIIAQVFRCWTSEETSKTGQPGITVSWYYRPEQTFHPVDRKFWEGEVFKTSHFADHPVEDIIEKIACQFTARHIRGRPRPPYWYLGFPLYVCDSRYNDRDRVFVKIKNWNSCIPEEVRKSTEFMPIYPFERTVYPRRFPSPFLVKGSKVKGPGGIVHSAPAPTEDTGETEMDKKKSNATAKRALPAGGSGDVAGPSKGQYVGTLAMAQSNTATSASTQQLQQPHQSAIQQVPQVVQQPPRPPGPDRSVFTAAGGAAQGSNIQIEKLPTETTKHFDRDPYTNEMLWFAAPPLNMTHAQPARHSLTYLHFLATKRKSERKQQQQNGDSNSNNGINGSAGVDEDADSVARKKIKMQQQEVKPTVREIAQKLWVEMGMDVDV